MFLELAFVLGLVHNLLLICVFNSNRVKNNKLIKTFGFAYLVLVIPLAIICLILSIFENKPLFYYLYLVIVLVYLGFEVVLDWVLKINFRSKSKLYLLIPYLMLYFFANYVLVILVWKENLTLGVILLALYIIQLLFNAFSHESVRRFFKSFIAQKS
ncbi:Uncharacterised protein [Candidatus Tiddalikarchaeum anstoanum]|nr:Uncharacterised protein [Candidatus Tiddalikarchaeum anstoanum]